MEDVMDMMEENTEGKMEFPRDVTVEDCFEGAQEPLYGFVTNVTIPEDKLEPCLLNIECFHDESSINATSSTEEEPDSVTGANLESRTQIPPNRQGIIINGTIMCTPTII